MRLTPDQSVKHMGRSSRLAAQGIIDMKALAEHFMEVNECTLDDFESHSREVSTEFQRRSEHEEWTVDWGPFQQYVRD